MSMCRDGVSMHVIEMESKIVIITNSNPSNKRLRLLIINEMIVILGKNMR